MTSATSLTAAPLSRRLFAMLYDGLLLLALLFIAAAIPLLFTGGKAVEGHNLIKSIYIISVSFVFFGWFWTHGGQTLGMRAWRLKLVQENGAAISWLLALLRFLSGLPGWLVFIIGIAFYFDPALSLPGILHLLQHMPAWSVMIIGIIWLTLDNWPNGWRAHLTHTRVILLPKQTASAQTSEQ